MAFVVTALVAGTVISGVSAYNSYKSQKKALKSQEAAQAQQLAMAKEQQKLAERDFNRANAKRVSHAQQVGRNANPSGVGSTMLTGAGGVVSSSLPLGGGSTLLGG